MNRIPPDVLEVLRSLQWEPGGVIARVDHPFDKHLFERVYEVLEDLGGHWSTAAGGHVFIADQVPAVVRAINAGEYSYEPAAA